MKLFKFVKTSKELQVGDKVTYIPSQYCDSHEWEQGIVKQVLPSVDNAVFVVYNCNGEWSNYQNYTSCSTLVKKLVKGWIFDEDDLQLDDTLNDIY